LEAAVASGHLPTLQGVEFALRGHVLVAAEGGPGVYGGWGSSDERKAGVTSALTRLRQTIDDLIRELTADPSPNSG
jgi:hypothetical protein